MYLKIHKKYKTAKYFILKLIIYVIYNLARGKRENFECDKANKFSFILAGPCFFLYFILR